jgi:hypothetical protein
MSSLFRRKGDDAMTSSIASRKKHIKINNQDPIQRLSKRIEGITAPYLGKKCLSHTKDDEVAAQIRSKPKRLLYSVSKHDRKSVLATSAATSSSRKRLRQQWSSSTLQPRSCDYGGIGLARPSLYLSFNDPSFIPKLEEEFHEHIDGFFGKVKTKAMKNQLNKDMLWKRIRAASQPSKSMRHQMPMSIGIPDRIHGKKFTDMSPDERVEAMIRAKLI